MLLNVFSVSFCKVTLLGDSDVLGSLHFPRNQNQNITKNDAVLMLLLRSMLGRVSPKSKIVMALFSPPLLLDKI